MKDNSTIKEKSLQPLSAVETTTTARSTVRERAGEATEPLDDRMLGALHAASDKKALDVVLLDLREIATFPGRFGDLHKP